MFRHYLTITRRLFARERGYTLINLTGLVLGLAAVLLAFVFVKDELAYDRFHEKGERIFRVNRTNISDSGERVKTAEVAGLLAPTMVENYPEVEAAARFMPWFEEVLLTHEDQSISARNMAFVDSNFFKLFNFELLRGQPEQVLSAPGQIVLTPELAETLFGDEDPVGKVVIGLEDKRYTVSGIIEAPQRRSHLQYDALVSWRSTTEDSGLLNYNFMNNWLGQTVYSYVLLDAAAREAGVEDKLPGLVQQYMPNRVGRYEFSLQPLSEVYLYSHDIRFLRGNKYGSIVFLRTFAIIGLFILLIACFNYVNISTAKSLHRAKEIGVKKMFGARRGQVLGQFLVETFSLVTLSAVAAFLAAQYLLPQLNSLFGRDIPREMLFQVPTVGFLLGVVIVVALLAGIFPGWVLSAFRPLGVLRKQGRTDPGGAWPRQVLTTLQLTLSVGLITGAIILNQQFRFLLSKDLGFDRDQVLVMDTPPGIEAQSTAFYNEVTAYPGVESLSICQAAIGSGTFGTTVIPEGSNGEEVPAQTFRVDTNFLKTYGMELAAGRFFSARFPADTSYGSIVVNEEMVRRMGWDDPLGRTIRFSPEGEPIPVVGVVEDFHYNTFHHSIDPIVMYLDRRKGNISVRFDAQNTGELLTHLQSTWKQFESRYPFDYFFVDQYFADNYQSEQQMLQTLGVFSLIAIFIACLGIYGLTVFSVTRRTKEIGIRKVLGASVSSILLLLHRRLFYLTVAGFLISVPLTYHFLHDWLDQYAYATPIHPWVFFLAGGLTLLIASLAVLGQSLRAASRNPVEALRYE